MRLDVATLNDLARLKEVPRRVQADIQSYGFPDILRVPSKLDFSDMDDAAIGPEEAHKLLIKLTSAMTYTNALITNTNSELRVAEIALKKIDAAIKRILLENSTDHKLFSIFVENNGEHFDQALKNLELTIKLDFLECFKSDYTARYKAVSRIVSIITEEMESIRRTDNAGKPPHGSLPRSS